MDRGEGWGEWGHDDMVVRHLALVRSLVHRLWKGRKEEDLFQVGVIGLIKAVKKFDPARGTAFSTYAVPVILGEIKGYLREDSLVKISRDLKRKGALLQEFRRRHLARTGREPTVEEAASHLGMDREEVAMIHETCLEPVSLQAAAAPGEGEGQRPLEQVVALETHEDLVEKVLLRETLQELAGAERQLIYLRYFREMSQAETGKVLHLSQVQVSRLEKKILQKLREKMV